MTFRDWIGIKEGQDPGAKNAIIAYSAARGAMLSKLQRRNISNRINLKQVEEYLSSLVFQKENTSGLGKQITDNFMETIIKMYNDTASAKTRVNENLDIANSRTYYTNDRLDAKLKEALDSVRIDENRKNETIRVYMQKRNFIMDKINNFNLNITEDNIQNIKKAISDIDKILIEYAKSLGGNDGTDNDLLKFLESKFNSSKSRQTILGKKVLGQSDWKETLLKLTQIDVIFSAIQKSDCLISTTTTGNLWEFFLMTASAECIDFAENYGISVTQEMVKDAKKNIIKGSSTTERNGMQFKIDDFDIESIGGTIIEETDKNNKVKKKVTIGNVSYEYHKNIDTGTSSSKKMGKIDVLFTVPDGDANSALKNQLRISAKNWNDIIDNTGKGKNIGVSDVLGAVSRNIGEKNEALLHMLFYSFQLPDYAEQRTNLSIHTKNFIRANIAADTIAGLSQSSSYADTLAILDRQHQKVHLIKINEELYNMINQNLYEELLFTVDNIDDEYSNYKRSAIEIRNASFNNKVKDKQHFGDTASNLYIKNMILLLRSMKVAARINPVQLSLKN